MNQKTIDDGLQRNVISDIFFNPSIFVAKTDCVTRSQKRGESRWVSYWKHRWVGQSAVLKNKPSFFSFAHVSTDVSVQKPTDDTAQSKISNCITWTVSIPGKRCITLEIHWPLEERSECFKIRSACVLLFLKWKMWSNDSVILVHILSLNLTRLANQTIISAKVISLEWCQVWY